jgi:hypothetical protein
VRAPYCLGVRAPRFPRRRAPREPLEVLPSSRRAPADRTGVQRTAGRVRARTAVRSYRGRRPPLGMSPSALRSQASAHVDHKRGCCPSRLAQSRALAPVCRPFRPPAPSGHPRRAPTSGRAQAKLDPPSPPVAPTEAAQAAHSRATTEPATALAVRRSAPTGAAEAACRPPSKANQPLEPSPRLLETLPRPSPAKPATSSPEFAQPASATAPRGDIVR